MVAIEGAWLPAHSKDVEPSIHQSGRNIPLANEMRQVQASVDGLRDTALANGADPNAEPTARVLRAADGATNSIAIAIEEGTRCCAIVRKHLESPQRTELTPEAWDTLRAALSYSRQELLRMGATL